MVPSIRKNVVSLFWKKNVNPGSCTAFVQCRHFCVTQPGSQGCTSNPVFYSGLHPLVLGNRVSNFFYTKHAAHMPSCVVPMAIYFGYLSWPKGFTPSTELCRRFSALLRSPTGFLNLIRRVLYPTGEPNTAYITVSVENELEVWES